jgi:hypothetical protein
MTINDHSSNDYGSAQHTLHVLHTITRISIVPAAWSMVGCAAYSTIVSFAHQSCTATLFSCGVCAAPHTAGSVNNVSSTSSTDSASSEATERSQKVPRLFCS